jgi:hypothetical protein
MKVTIYLVGVGHSGYSTKLIFLKKKINKITH